MYVEISNGPITDYTRIVDYTGNLHTVQYLLELFEVQMRNYALEYDPNSPVDVIITLGADWGTKENQ